MLLHPRVRASSPVGECRCRIAHHECTEGTPAIHVVWLLSVQVRAASGSSCVVAVVDMQLHACSVASVGNCAAVLGEQVGGFAMATSEAKALCQPDDT